MIFKPGDRVRYFYGSGFALTEMIGKEGEVLEGKLPNNGHQTYVDFGEGADYYVTANLELVVQSPEECRQQLVEEFFAEESADRPSDKAPRSAFGDCKKFGWDDLTYAEYLSVTDSVADFVEQLPDSLKPDRLEVSVPTDRGEDVFAVFLIWD